MYSNCILNFLYVQHNNVTLFAMHYGIVKNVIVLCTMFLPQ